MTHPPFFSVRCRDEVPDVFSILSVNTESRDSKNLLVLLSLEENVQKKKTDFEKICESDVLHLITMLSAPGMSHWSWEEKQKCFSRRHNGDRLTQVTAVASATESKKKKFFFKIHSLDFLKTSSMSGPMRKV